MHKGIIVLTKAEDKAEALKNVKGFLGEYEETVWDWYAIGGRWSGTLSPHNKEFVEKAKGILKPEEGGFVSQKEVDNNQGELQSMWESIGGIGTNPYFDHYKLPDDGGVEDIMPLSECIEIVKEWEQTIEVAKKEELDAKRWLAIGGNIRRDKNEPWDDWNMYGYSLRKAGELYQQNFCFDCNVFNTETYNYSIPDDTTGYFAVMVDIHN